MSQTQTSPTLGAQAAAAASTNKGAGGNAPAAAKPADAKPADAKAADTKPADAKTDDKGTGSNAGAGAEAAPKKKGENRIFIIVGEVHEFESSAKAEKFLNGEGAPTQYSVLRGKKLKTNSKVSLR